MNDSTSQAGLLPRSVQLNAWPGEPAVGPLVDNAQVWGARRGLPPGQEPLKFDKPVDPTKWDHDDVGYGILLPDTLETKWSEAKAKGTSAPAPIRELLSARPQTQLLYWFPDLGDIYIRRYYDDGTMSDLQIGLTVFGTAKNRLPRYVLIVGGPQKIPWSVQYSLAIRHAVGRLPFDGDDLGPYVSAMLDGEEGWATTQTDAAAPVVWTVDHGPDDITRLMRSTLSSPLVKALSGTLPGLVVIKDSEATGSALIKALDAKPALVVTSSHGATPLEGGELRKALGLPMDIAHAAIPVTDLANSMPGGAVWFAQACCSAGSSAESRFSDLLAAGTTARAVVDAVTSLGSAVAPAPLALLSRERPVRAVFGHVEPTFDWTLRDPETGQRFGGDLVGALSSNLHHGQPIGLILSEYRAAVGVLTNRWVKLSVQLNRDHDNSVLPTMTRLRLTAWDRQSLVLLGDPTVHLPAIR